MSGERQALRNYRERRLGYYVVNPRTDLAVAYFKDEERANAEAVNRNSPPPLAPVQLQVVAISEPTPSTHIDHERNER